MPCNHSQIPYVQHYIWFERKCFLLYYFIICATNFCICKTLSVSSRIKNLITYILNSISLVEIQKCKKKLTRWHISLWAGERLQFLKGLAWRVSSFVADGRLVVVSNASLVFTRGSRRPLLWLDRIICTGHSLQHLKGFARNLFALVSDGGLVVIPNWFVITCKLRLMVKTMLGIKLWEHDKDYV